MPPRVPLARRIADDLRAQIESGQRRPGSELPSIAQLCDTYDCSATPVKAALRELQLLGLIEGHPGKANYVADPPPP